MVTAARVRWLLLSAPLKQVPSLAQHSSEMSSSLKRWTKSFFPGCCKTCSAEPMQRLENQVTIEVYIRETKQLRTLPHGQAGRHLWSSPQLSGEETYQFLARTCRIPGKGDFPVAKGLYWSDITRAPPWQRSADAAEGISVRNSISCLKKSAGHWHTYIPPKTQCLLV